ncbi:MAG: YkgJ family cysteine cluster protein [Peptococcaceae bacterium]|nr:YkgJ family cysteine cluster protein [Peptococcaceae bacterium]
MAFNGGNPGRDPGIFGAGGSFRFDCHRGLSCFGQCCRDINIYLTPYDILRLRKRLGIPSAEFINKYTCELVPPGMRFPVLYLKMNEEDRLKCLFLTSQGCAVYEDRPWSCRMAPVDIVGPGMFRIAFDREKCLGLNENREWTVEQWMEMQDMPRYDAMEASFREIPRLIRFTGQDNLDRRIVQLFRLVCYDADNFREFILKNKFLIKEAGLDPADFTRCLKEDADRLKAGVRWLVSVCNNVKTLKKIDKIL